jgi:hypothetical protein
MRRRVNSRHVDVMTQPLDSYVSHNITLTRAFGGPRGTRTHNPRIKSSTVFVVDSKPSSNVGIVLSARDAEREDTEVSDHARASFSVVSCG